MGEGTIATFRDLSQPQTAERNGQLISNARGWAELELTDSGPPVEPGTLVGFETSKLVLMGRVDSAELVDSRLRLRVRVEHWLELQNASSVQKLWSEEQPT